MPGIVLGDSENKDKEEILPALKGPTTPETNDGSNNSSGESTELLTFIECSPSAQHCPKHIYIYQFI